MLVPSTSPAACCSSAWIAAALRARAPQGVRLMPPMLDAGPSLPLMIQVDAVSGVRR